MKNRKNTTRKALLMSVLSMLLCCTMLVGTTFAWFTDTVTTGTNRIVAGNLDVELEYLDADGEWQKVTEDTKLFNELEADGETKNLWEPGHTEVVYLKVSNLGTLALKYQFAVTPINETKFENVLGDKNCVLSDYLVFGQAVSDEEIEKYATREEAWEAAGNTLGLKDFAKSNDKLMPGSAEYVALIVYMPTTVGNEANYRGDVVPSIDLGVTLVATQTPYEEDSFGKDYDAAVPVYPAGVTAESFGQQTVYIWHDQRTMDNIVVNSQGKYFYDVATAIDETPAGGTLYFKEGAIPYYDKGIYENNPEAYGHKRVKQQALYLTKSITIYANGVDFCNFTVGGDYNNSSTPKLTYGNAETFNIYNNGQAIPEEDTVNIKIVNAKNFKIYGKSGAEVANTTYNIIMEGCVNDGVQLYNVTGSQFGCINTTMTNCKVSNLTETSAIGSFRQNGDNVVKNCVFENVGCGVDANMETANGKKSILVEGCTFINCGSTDASSAWLAPMRIVKTKTCEFSLTLKDNTFTNTNLADVRGDVVLHWGDDKTYSFNCELTTDMPIMIKTTSDIPVACNSGNIQIIGK